MFISAFRLRFHRGGGGLCTPLFKVGFVLIAACPDDRPVLDYWLECGHYNGGLLIGCCHRPQSIWVIWSFLILFAKPVQFLRYENTHSPAVYFLHHCNFANGLHLCSMVGRIPWQSDLSDGTEKQTIDSRDHLFQIPLI